VTIDSASRRYQAMIGAEGIGSGAFFALDGHHMLGREESRSGRLLDRRDYCKLHKELGPHALREFARRSGVALSARVMKVLEMQGRGRASGLAWGPGAPWGRDRQEDEVWHGR
jgi:hypothetical protein